MPNIHVNDNNELFKKFLFESLEEKLKENKKWSIENFDELFESYMNSLIKTEFELFLRSTDSNVKRNGYVNKTIKTTHGTIEVKVPRDRNGEFKSEIFVEYSTYTEELAKSIIKLYQLGLSTTDVSDFINDIYGVVYSKQSISAMTQVTSDIVDKFKQRVLGDRYIALFLDATYIPVKFANSYEKQAVHLVVGINSLGYQEILGYVIGFKENKALWGDVLDDIVKRGVKEVDIFVSDGFVGIDTVVKARFPNSRIQRCTVHILRNVMGKVTARDTASVIADFKELFRLTDREVYDKQLKYLKDKYSKYYQPINEMFNNEYVSTYLDFPKCIHRTIKTTNRVEAVNQKIKTRIRFKQNFPNLESMERMLVSSIIAQNNKSTRLVAGIEDYLKSKIK